MKKQGSLTALLSAFARAYHIRQEAHPLFADPVAEKLFAPGEYRQLCQYLLDGVEALLPGGRGAYATDEEALRALVYEQFAPTPLARQRFCEDALQTAVRTGTRQVVILGAGLDTFALREPDFAAQHPVFEVDHPNTQADKRQRIARAGLAVPPGVSWVAADLSRGELVSKLLEAGFDPRQKTFFSALGLSYYLAPEELAALLGELSALSARGSSLVFDYAGAGLFLSQVPRVQRMVAMAAAGGEPMKCCFDALSLTRLLETQGFLVYESLSPQEIQQRYFAPFAGSLRAFEEISFVLAVSQGTR